ncbi:MAG: SDR family NAD(P)-dependent oxidoreductase, partial [Eubacteriales bacterium]|nr:SDR family NAD(P)-dependent oxidoreductase [Eubacteriales bacterium]
MDILVTGGAGYIGSHTCVELLERGFGVVVVDNLVNSCEKSLERVRDITGKDLTFYENDVRDRAALDRIFEKHDISCV